MIDNFTLIVSLGLLVYILVRAVILDRTLPWYPVETTDETAPTDPQSDDAPGAGPARRQPAPGAGRFRPRFRELPPQ